MKKSITKRICNNIFCRIRNTGIFNKMSDEKYLKMLYYIRLKKKLNLDNPQTFNEKLQWLKINDRRYIYTTMADKYAVKEYVSENIGKQYIIPTIGIYDNFDDINFNELPKSFVIKCTHDSGGLVIVKDKEKMDKEVARKKIESCLKTNYFSNTREWCYKNIKPRILIEKYMQNKDDEDLKDYKFYCFNGEPIYLYVSEGLSNHKTAKIGFFDMDFKKAKFGRSDYDTFDKKIKKPKHFEQMKLLSKKLSKEIPFVRVDLYEINNEIYFGEMTFYPCSGLMPFEPKEWDLKLGNQLELPNKKGDLND